MAIAHQPYTTSQQKGAILIYPATVSINHKGAEMAVGIMGGNDNA